ncbi:hypothetical protein OMW55_01960 [Sphingomonas sp. BN140010]|uniref:N-acetyltransferase n=1 Tax=Sphingomonas arvum TaxID=2992113 RepID=A0ABT3JC11_9SPHN|nr:hypothetical protein [Sphingomonas sp. BN140010]MCW3796574.1 hypothetical protein [Sphingomonas sp. BN140010]
MTKLQTLPLTLDMVPAALPLLRMTQPHLSLPEWQAAAARLTAGEGSGVLTLATSGGQLLGIAAWRVEPHDRHGLALKVDPFVLCELSGRAPGRERLCAALQEMAEQRGCDTVLFAPHSRGLFRPALTEVN